MPIAFLAGILRTRLQRAGIADLVIALGNGRPLRDALADALGDPSLQPRVLVVAAPGLGRRGGAHADRAHRARRTCGDVRRERRQARGGAPPRPEPGRPAGARRRRGGDGGLAFEKERLQAELRAQYRFLETIIDTAPSLLSVVDTEGRIRNFNHAVEVASGLRGPRARIEGRYFWEIFIDPAEREAMIQRFRDASPAFPASEYENVFTNALGRSA